MQIDIEKGILGPDGEWLGANGGNAARARRYEGALGSVLTKMPSAYLRHPWSNDFGCTEMSHIEQSDAFGRAYTRPLTWQRALRDSLLEMRKRGYPKGIGRRHVSEFTFNIENAAMLLMHIEGIVDGEWMARARDLLLAVNERVNGNSDFAATHSRLAEAGADWFWHWKDPLVGGMSWGDWLAAGFAERGTPPKHAIENAASRDPRCARSYNPAQNLKRGMRERMLFRAGYHWSADIKTCYPTTVLNLGFHCGAPPDSLAELERHCRDRSDWRDSAYRWLRGEWKDGEFRCHESMVKSAVVSITNRCGTRKLKANSALSNIFAQGKMEDDGVAEKSVRAAKSAMQAGGPFSRLANSVHAAWRAIDSWDGAMPGNDPRLNQSYRAYKTDMQSNPSARSAHSFRLYETFERCAMDAALGWEPKAREGIVMIHDGFASKREPDARLCEMEARSNTGIPYKFDVGPILGK